MQFSPDDMLGAWSVGKVPFISMFTVFYFMRDRFIAAPLCSWYVLQAEAVSRPYSDWSLGLAALLAVSSLLPIAGAALCWAARGCRGRPRADSVRYESGGLFHRVDTTASTKPMLDNFEVSPGPIAWIQNELFVHAR